MVVECVWVEVVEVEYCFWFVEEYWFDCVV